MCCVTPPAVGWQPTPNEIACQSNVSIWLDEETIPVSQPLKAARQMLGFDPLYIANEGKVIVIVPQDEASGALAAMKRSPYGVNACQDR